MESPWARADPGPWGSGLSGGSRLSLLVTGVCPEGASVSKRCHRGLGLWVPSSSGQEAPEAWTVCSGCRKPKQPSGHRALGQRAHMRKNPGSLGASGPEAPLALEPRPETPRANSCLLSPQKWGAQRPATPCQAVSAGGPGWQDACEESSLDPGAAWFPVLQRQPPEASRTCPWPRRGQRLLMARRLHLGPQGLAFYGQV